jgi:hypothetical protein
MALCLSVCLSIYGFTVLFVGLGQLFQLLDLLYSRLESLDEGSARRKAHAGQHKQNKRTDIHASSGIGTQDLSV